jgi:hypothetical protein
MGKYDEGTEVVFYDNHKGDNQKFVVNKDGTISPLKAPGVVLGMQATSLKHDEDGAEQ